MRGFGGELAHDLAELQKLQGGQKGWLKNQVGKRQAQVIYTTKRYNIYMYIYNIYIYMYKPTFLYNV